LSQIDWLQCHEFACNSLVKVACDLWNSGIHSTVRIGNQLKLDKNTIREYLRQGKLLNWCDYNPKDVAINNGKRCSKLRKIKIICLNNNKVFNSVVEASTYCKLKSSTHIVQCCKGNRKTSGKNPVTGESLKWMYYNEYLKQNKEAI
jgi:hypothetical protein